MSSVYPRSNPCEQGSQKLLIPRVILWMRYWKFMFFLKKFPKLVSVCIYDIMILCLFLASNCGILPIWCAMHFIFFNKAKDLSAYLIQQLLCLVVFGSIVLGAKLIMHNITFDNTNLFQQNQFFSEKQSVIIWDFSPGQPSDIISWSGQQSGKYEIKLGHGFVPSR